MTAPISQETFSLCLSSEGESLELTNIKRNGLELPEQAEATACKTHEQVLTFLKKLRDSEVKNQISCSHRNNYYYKAHWGHYPKGSGHECSLEDLIDFVKYRISEQKHGVRTKPSMLLPFIK